MGAKMAPIWPPVAPLLMAGAGNWEQSKLDVPSVEPVSEPTPLYFEGLLCWKLFFFFCSFCLFDPPRPLACITSTTLLRCMQHCKWAHALLRRKGFRNAVCPMNLKEMNMFVAPFESNTFLLVIISLVSDQHLDKQSLGLEHELKMNPWDFSLTYFSLRTRLFSALSITQDIMWLDILKMNLFFL